MIERLQNVALAIGIATLIIGIMAVLRPRQMSAKFGIPLTGTGLPYVISTGIRDVFIGITILILFYQEMWRVLGLVIGCLSLIAVSDFLVVKVHGSKRASYVHAVGAGAVLVYGIWLFLNF